MSSSTSTILNSLTSTSSLDTTSGSLTDRSLNNINNSELNNDNQNMELFLNFNLKTHNLFSINENVKLIVDLELFKQIQEESHAGWNKKMAYLIGKIGQVHRITDKGDIRVKYENEPTRWTIYPFALNRFKSEFFVGDIVFTNCDERVVKYLMRSNWKADLLKFLGKFCKITNLRQNGDLILNYKGFEFEINKECCYSINNSNRYEFDSTFNNLQETTKIMINEFKELSLVEQKQNLDLNIVDLCVKTSANGNLIKVKEILLKYPNLVDEKSNGKTALHVSCLQGHKEIVEYLIGLNANINIKDSDGDTPVHCASFAKKPDIIEILARNKADLNLINKNGCSALHVAVNKFFVDCVRILLKYNCDVNLQDSYGDSPLHDIIGKKSTPESVEILDLLLDAPLLDFKIKNKRGFNLLHHACLKGNLMATEKLLNKCSELINHQKVDGYSPIHLAALNGHKHVIECLINHKADLEVKTIRQQTPLLLSIAKFNIPIIELLVENYTNVNAYDEDLDTSLHLVLNEALEKDSSLSLSPVKTKLVNYDEALMSVNKCKNICQILDLLPHEFRSNIRLIIAVYLIKNGADLYFKNRNNFTCLDYIKDIKLKNFLVDYYNALHMDINGNFKHTNFVSNSGFIYSNKCKLCDEEPISVNFLPCNHKCVCLDCSIRIKKCIECHHLIKEKQNLNGININLNKIEFSELLEKVKYLEEAQTCPICMERKKDTTFQCGHIVCNVCSQPLIYCHICREKILTKIKIYEN